MRELLAHRAARSGHLPPVLMHLLAAKEEVGQPPMKRRREPVWWKRPLHLKVSTALAALQPMDFGRWELRVGLLVVSVMVPMVEIRQPVVRGGKVKRRGRSLVTVLIASSVVVVLAFAAAGMSTANLLLTGRAVHQTTARNLAEAGKGHCTTVRPTLGLWPQPTAARCAWRSVSPGTGFGGLYSFDRQVKPIPPTTWEKTTTPAGWRGLVVPRQSVT